MKSEFAKRLKWVADAIPGATYELVVTVNTNPLNDSVVVNNTYVFTLRDRSCGIAAELLERSPDVAANELSRELGVPNAHGAVTWDQWSRQQHDASESPVGDQWAEKGSVVYKFKPGVDVTKWPEGATYVGDLDGRETTFVRVRVVIRPGTGPMGLGGEYAPAWKIKG